MLDMIKERSAAGARFPEMNLQSMLSAHARQNSREGPGGPGTGVPGGKMGASDSSLSPHSPAEHDRDEDLREAEMEEERGGGVRGEREHGHADSSGRDERHLSEEVRAQVFADLRRFSSRAVAAAAGIGGGATLTPAAPVNSEPATSTTTSPPLPPHVSAIPQPPERARSLEDSLPPRKRKVSQEHHNLAAMSASEGFNGGVHDHNSRDSSGSSRDSKASPVKMAPHANTVGDTDPSVPPSAPNADNDSKKGLEEDASSRALECRN